VKRFIPAFLIVILTLVFYAPALLNGFVWDDSALVQRDPLIRSWRLIPEAFQHFLFTDATASDFYRPIQRITYTIDYAAFGFRPDGYHFTSILWHAAAALTLLVLASELLRFFGAADPTRRRIAFLAALAWSIHPLHTSAVVYISGRADSLAATFGFLGLYCALRSLRSSARDRWILLILAGGLFLLSGLSKEAGLVFLALWSAALISQRRWKELIPATVVCLFVAVTYLSLRLPAEHQPAPTLRPPPQLLERPILVARAVAEYAGLILLPINLHMERDVETHPKGDEMGRADIVARRELQTILGILLAAGTIYWLLRSRQRNGPEFCCLLLAITAYIPVSGLIPLNATVAEHWLYLPSAFLFLAGALFISRLSIPPVVIGSIFAIWLVFLGARTFTRTFDWKDQRTFIERTIANGGDSPRMRINLAGLEINEGRLDQAKENLALALHEEPEHPLAILHLLTIAIRKDDFSTAHDLLDRAVKMPLIEPRAQELSALLEQKEKGQLDVRRMRLAARTGPPNWSIEKRYVQALDQSGATGAAITELKSCLQTQWYRAETWSLLSALLAKDGQQSAATAAQAQANDYDVHLSAK
jgi:hypothetical protein